MPEAEAPYIYRRRLRFGEADPARIAYTVRLFDISMEALEGWFRDVGGFDWYDINVRRNMGTPFVRVEMDMRAPVVPGDDLRVAVWVEGTGRSSIRFTVEARREADDVLTFVGRWVCSVVDTTLNRSIPIPQDLAARIATYRAACETADAARA